MIERKDFPRDKTCGDGLTPRAVHQLEEMGLGHDLTRFHRYDGLRAIAHGISMELQWPEHPVFPSYGYVVKRRDLDEMVAGHAAAAGAVLRQGTEAIAPIIDATGLAARAARGEGRRPRARPRRSGRATSSWPMARTHGSVGPSARSATAPTPRGWPSGIAITGYESPLHAEPWIESALDVRDRNGNSLPGYGWIFPVGDGTINVGIGLLSTFRDWKKVNTSHLMDEFAATAPAYWGISPATATCAPTGGRLPMGGSVSPNVGPTWVLVGDAAGMINPFNGERASTTPTRPVAWWPGCSARP